MSKQCCDVVLCSISSLRIVSCNITFSLSQCRFVSVPRVVSQSTPVIQWETMSATGMMAAARVEVYLYIPYFLEEVPGSLFNISGERRSAY